MKRGETSSEAEVLKRLDALRPRYERLRADRIRAESDVERLEAELEAARARAREELGTDDEDEIRAMIEAARERSAREVEAFAALVAEIEARLGRLGREP